MRSLLTALAFLLLVCITQIAFDSSPGTVSINPSGLKLVNTQKCSDDLITTIQISPSGNILVKASRSGNVIIFDLLRHREIRQLKVPLNYPVSIGLISEHEVFIMDGPSGDVLLVNISMEASHKLVIEGLGPSNCTIFDKYNKNFIIATSGSVLIKDLNGNHKGEIRLSKDDPSALCFNRSNTLLAIGTTSGDLKLISLKSLTEKLSKNISNNCISNISIHPTRDLVAVLSMDNKIKLLRLKDLKEQTVLKPESIIHQLTFDASGSYLIASGNSGIELFDVSKSKKVRLLKTSCGIVCFSYNKILNSIICIEADNLLRIFAQGPSQVDEPQKIERHRGFLGIQHTSTDNGSLINSVLDQTAASSVGLKSADIITQIDDVKITSSDDLINFITNANEGDLVHLMVKREGISKLFRVRLGRYPD